MNFGKSVRESVELCMTTLEEITAAEKELAAARKAGKIAPADAEAKSAELARARADAAARRRPAARAGGIGPVRPGFGAPDRCACRAAGSRGTETRAFCPRPCRPGATADPVLRSHGARRASARLEAGRRRPAEAIPGKAFAAPGRVACLG